MSASHFIVGSIITCIGIAAVQFARKYFKIDEVEFAKPLSPTLKEAIRESIAEAEPLPKPAVKKKIRKTPATSKAKAEKMVAHGHPLRLKPARKKKG